MRKLILSFWIITALALVTNGQDNSLRRYLDRPEYVPAINNNIAEPLKDAYTLVDQFPAPDNAPRGLTFEGNYLYNVSSTDGGGAGLLYRIDPNSGLVVDSYAYPPSQAYGITFDGNYFLVSYWDELYRLDPSTFALVSSITLEREIFDLTWDGSNIWASGTNINEIYKIDPATGIVLTTYTLGSRPFGITYANGLLYVGDDGLDQILVVDPGTGTVIEQSASPGTYPAGLAFDGQYIWVSDWDTDIIYKLDFSPDISVSPSSLNETLAPEESSTQTLNISNVGDATLDWVLDITYMGGIKQKYDPENLNPALIPGPEGLKSDASLTSGQPEQKLTLNVDQPVIEKDGADPASVLYLNTNAGEDLLFTGLVSGLPNVATFDVINGMSETPNTDYLLMYDVVIVASNWGWADAITLGDNLASYSDLGGAVLTLNGTTGAGGGWTLGGAITGPDYLPFALTDYTLSENTCTSFIGHPITEDVSTITTSIWVWSVLQGDGISLGAYATGGYPVGAYNPNRPIVSLNVFINDGYWEGDLIQMIYNTINWFGSGSGWLSCSPVLGSIPAGSSSVIDANFDATGLVAGVYEANIIIGSNDPDEPMVTVPVTLTVEGIPDITVTPTFLDETLEPEGSSTQTLNVGNVGDATLNWVLDITYMGGIEQKYDPEDLNPALIPGPEGLKSDASSTSGQPEQKLTLNVDQPVIEKDGADPASVLYLTTNAGYDPLFTGLVSGLPNVATFDVIDGRYETPNTDYLLMYDVVMVSSDYGWADAITVGDNLASYSDLGGKVLTLNSVTCGSGPWILGGAITGPDYMPIAITDYTYPSTNTCTSFIGHPITEDVTTISSSLFAHSVLQGDGISLGAYATGGYPVGAYNPNRPIVSLNVFVNDGWWEGDLIQMIYNTINWFGSGSGWLSCSPVLGSIPPGSSSVIDANFDATGLVAGVYEANIIIGSDDPDEPMVTVPVTLTVEGIPDITVTPTFLDETLEPEGSSTQTLNVGNVGDGELNYSLYLENLMAPGEVPEFDVDSYPYTGPPIAADNLDGGMQYVPEFSKQVFTNPEGAALENILVLEDIALLDPHYNTALENLGLSRTLVTTFSDFEAELTGGTPWDLVIFNSYNYPSPVSVLDALNSYLAGGGHLIFADWDVYNYAAHPLLGSMGISWVSDLTTPVNFSATVPSSPVFNVPNNIYDLYWTDNQGNRDGQIANVIGGATQLAAYAGYPSSGAIVLNSTERCFFNAFQAVNFNGDDDGDGKPDIVELIENQIYYMMADSPFWLSCSPVSGAVPAGGSSAVDASFDATGLAAGEYHANINIFSNDPDEPMVTVPVTLTVEDVGIPDITVTPTFLDETLEPEGSSTQTLNVGNVGDGDLNFYIQLQEIDLADAVVEFDVDSYPYTGQPFVGANSNGSKQYLPEFSKQIYKSSAAAVFENILVLEEGVVINHYNTALENLGLSRTVVFTFPDFEAELTGGTDWDLVIFNSYDLYTPVTVLDAVNTYLAAGGHLIFADWDVFNYTGHPLLGSLGISFVSDFTTPNNFSATVPSSSVFHTPNIISDFYWTDDQYDRDGEIVDVIGGATGLAAFEGYPLSGAIVLNSSGNSFFNAFQVWNFNGDDDSDGKLDIVELIENQIYYLMADSPFWLTCSPVSGTVPAGGSSVIDANFDATGLDEGEYHANINIGSNDPDEPMVTVPVTLTVGGGCEPGWTVVTYTNSTTAYGIVTIDDIGTPASTGDLVGAFVDEECRGIGEVVINGGIAYVTLLIQGDVVERAEFRIWDASECTIIPEAYCADTDPGGILGYPPDYLPIGSGEGCVVEQTLTHNTGWNLISLYVHPDDMSPASIFADFTCLLQVKDMTQSYDPALPPFLNTLTELTDGMGYFTNSSCLEEHIIVGQLVDGPATPIDLSAGWNLIGYPFDTPTAPEVAFASLISAGNLVQVKSMTQSYDPALPPFLNTLTTLEPGKGYFINVNSNVTFNYPAPAGAALKSAEAGTIQSPWSTMKYTQSMVQYGNVTLDGFPIDGEAVVGAFVNNECRGQGAVKEAGGETFTTLVINGDKVENVAFKLFQNGNTYSSNTMTVNNPGGITQAVTDIQFLSSLLDEIDLRVYPNPAKDYLTIAYELNMHSKVNITILDMLGKVVYTYQEMNEAGSHRMTLENVKTMYNMNEGTYILKFSNIEYTTSQKIMIQ